MIYKSVDELVGNTPLLEIENDGVRILAKLECFNPAGSAKDRVGLYMIKEAEEKGILKKGSVIIEPTSGNTGIGLCAVASTRGYKVILTMPDTMSVERINLLKAYGAEVVLTEGAKGMNGAVEKALELSKNYENSFIPSQFENPVNPKAHYETTGPEIWNDTEGQVDVFVAGVGTGGTISGVGKFLKEKNENIKIVAVEPEKSPLLSKGEAGSHGLMGIGANFVPKILDLELVDEIITVTEDDAYKFGKEMAQKFGVLVGITSGAALYAAKLLATREENKNKTIVALLPDTGERYLSTPMFE